MARKFLVYEITSIVGTVYIGCTSLSLADRWRHHVKRASKFGGHRLYEDIRLFGPDFFTLRVLSTHDTANEGYAAEAKAIAESADKYNLSPSHYENLATATAVLKEKLLDPVWKAQYQEKLSAGVKASAAHKSRLPDLIAAGNVWRKNNARLVWKNAYRASRIAKRNSAGTTNNPVKWTEEQKAKASEIHLERWKNAPPSVRKRRSVTAKSAATKQWAGRSPEQKAAIAAKISATLKAKNAARTPEQKAQDDAALARARVKIDHDVRKAKQKEFFAKKRA